GVQGGFRVWPISTGLGHAGPSGPYSTRTRYSPWAGAVGPVLRLSRSARYAPGASGGRRPVPTRTSVPTIIRTMWRRNRSAVSHTRTRDPVRAHPAAVRVQTVVREGLPAPR